MIKVFAHNLNSHGDMVHPICRYALDTLIHYLPDKFQESPMRDCDCVLTNAPAAPPYCFDVRTAEDIISLNKPVFILSDADGYMPDCEGECPDKIHNFQNFVRYYEGIKGYFYREHWEGYERPDLKFPLFTFELVGYLWNEHPKDRADWTKVTNKTHFMSRRWALNMAQSLNCRSRIALFKALEGFPGCTKRDLYVSGKLPATVFMNELLESRMAIALEGSGIKTVSQVEVPMCSLLVTHSLPMRHTYPWIDGVNCIKLPYIANAGDGSFIHNEGRGLVDGPAAVEKLKQHATQLDLLWQLFCECQENARKYQIGPYYREHVGKKIVEHL